MVNIQLILSFIKPLGADIPKYIPTTLFGLIGLFVTYLYLYFKNKDDNQLRRITSASPSDKVKILEMEFNGIGFSVDTSNLSNDQKYDLLINTLLLQHKRRRIRILFVFPTLIITGFLITFLIWNHENIKPVLQNDHEKPDRYAIDNIITQIKKNYYSITYRKLKSRRIWGDASNSYDTYYKNSRNEITVIKSVMIARNIINVTTEYDFKNNKLYFIYYRSTTNATEPYEDRKYIYNDTVVKEIQNKSAITCKTDCTFNPESEAYKLLRNGYKIKGYQ